ncbi:MAG: Uma2 family endonuclease [Hyphomicrobiaceae bacterium]
MSTLAQKLVPVTIAEFDVFVENQADDAVYELVDGQIVMMTNPNQRHEQITANIGAPLKLAMDKRRCRTYQGGMRVQISDNVQGVDKSKPDVVVRCGSTEPVAETRNYITDPLVIVEVLSPSTMDYDRGDKLDFYKLIPTMRHIVIAYQDQMRVEHYRRVPGGWEMDVLTKGGDRLVLEAVAFQMSLTQVYFDVAMA